jgi:fructokinase
LTSIAKPRIFGTGLIALDLVMSADPQSPVRSWAGGTCGNILSILAYLGWEAYPIARMNSDPASERVRADMDRWGVRLDFASCDPTADTPIIIQQIRRGRDGKPKHRFSWSCPKCGKWLPSFKPVTMTAVETIAPSLDGVAVFFLDRLSRASLTLARAAADCGGVVVFEPSGKATDKMMREALALAHVVKYADQRLMGVKGVMRDGTATIVEVQTLGEQGLRYRHRFGRKPSDWLHLKAVAAPHLADACGSGDWCTAGLVAKVASGGLAGLRNVGAQGVRAALRYGQTLAAWNCGFEGARGGMYAVPRETFSDQIVALLRGQFDVSTNERPLVAQGDVINCPACAQARGRRRTRNPRAKRAA